MTNYVKIHWREGAHIDERGMQQPGRICQEVHPFNARDVHAVHVAVQWAERESKRLAAMGRDARIAVWNRLAQRPSWPSVGQQRQWN